MLGCSFPSGNQYLGRPRRPGLFREANTLRKRNCKIHGGKQRARIVRRSSGKWSICLVRGLWHGRLGKFRSGDHANTLPAGINLQAAHRYRRHAALGARETGSDAPVQKYCPIFPQKQWPITTRELLGHLAGIRHYHPESENDPELYNIKHFEQPIEDGLKFFENDPLLSKPGTQFHYSTHGYTVVGCAIQGASGEKYADYLRENVLLAAGMAHTQLDDRYALIARRTRFYQKNKAGEVVNADFVDSSYKVPGGGWLSSADDMAQFEAAILNDRLIHRPTRDLMWAPQKTSDGAQNGYALGWGTLKDGDVAEIAHTGNQQGTSTAIVLAPEKKAAVVVLINIEGVEASTVAKELLKIALATAAADPGK